MLQSSIIISQSLFFQKSFHRRFLSSKTETFFRCMHEQMTDAQEDIKSNLVVVTPEIQSRKRDEDKDTSLRDQINRKETVMIQRKDEREFPHVLGWYY